jgi:hypothetical protein
MGSICGWHIDPHQSGNELQSGAHVWVCGCECVCIVCMECVLPCTADAFTAEIAHRARTLIVGIPVGTVNSIPTNFSATCSE